MAVKKPKVLIVDDRRGIRLTLAGIIEDQGYEVAAAEDGFQAIEAATETDFDLIFMDIQMPGINGVQTYREIKQIRPESIVVMMTGFAVEELVKDALDEGVFSVIYKPFDTDRVVKLVEAVHRTVVILVVDDRSSDRKTLRMVLDENGYRVAEADDGTQAIDMVKDRHYDVIFMDIHMPGKDGVSAFDEIKRVDPEARVIFTTGFPMDDSVSKVLEAGAYPVADKTMDPANILSLVKKISMENA